jgi:hypothetical protein
MPRQRKSVSLRQLPLNAFVGIQLCGGRKKALGVGGRVQQIGGFFKRLVIFELEHHHGLFPVAGNNQSFVIVANPVHGAGKICADSSVSNLMR